MSFQRMAFGITSQTAYTYPRAIVYAIPFCGEGGRRDPAVRWYGWMGVSLVTLFTLQYFLTHPRPPTQP